MDQSSPSTEDMDRREAHIGALDDWQRKQFLAYLCGGVPEWVDRALDSVERYSTEGQS